MRKHVKLSALVIGAALLCGPAAFAQEAGGAPAPVAGANTMQQFEAKARADVAAASADPAGGPVVNPPDPQNAGTLAENVRTTALATYPWSTADTWFGAR